MRFREIRTKEKITDTCVTKKEENVIDITKRIKPATDMEIENARAFWDNMFVDVSKRIVVEEN